MEAFLPEPVKTFLLGLIAIALVLGWLARRFPDVPFLKVFRLPELRLSEEERARRKRAGNRRAAVEIILLGLVLPPLYILSRVMMFNDVDTIPMIIVGACSVSCFALAIWIFVKN